MIVMVPAYNLQSCGVIPLLMDMFGQLLANMKPSKSASVFQGMAATPRKCKVGIDNIVVGYGVRPHMQDMSIGENEGEKGGESSKMVL